MMADTIYLNAFTRLTQDSVTLGEMQVANPRHRYPLADAPSARPEIDVTVSVNRDLTTARAVFDSPEVGYFERRGVFYYRNCNVANAVARPEVFYRGRLPNSLLHICMRGFDPIVIDVATTRNFVRESRSRLTRVATLDQTINHLLLACAVFRGHMPMHAASIEAGTPAARYSLLFMGLPNTGKTGTSVAVRKLLDGEYLAEDICFVAPDTLAVHGGPYTLDETKLQNYNELRARKFTGAPVKAIAMLQRKVGPDEAIVIPAGDPRIEDFLVEMNRYEFEWNHDLVLRHLMLGGGAAGFSIANVTRLYLAGLKRIAGRVPVVRVAGENPGNWAPLLLRTLTA